MKATSPHSPYVAIGSDNGLVPSGNLSLPELMFAEIHFAIWRHEVTMGWCVMGSTRCYQMGNSRAISMMFTLQQLAIVIAVYIPLYVGGLKVICYS